VTVTMRHLQGSNMSTGVVTVAQVASRPRLRNVEYEDVTVDAAYAQLLRHHTSTPDELAEAVAFSQENFSFRQLRILLSHMGPRLPILAENVHVERKNRGAVLRAEIRFSLDVRWTSGRLIVSHASLPETMAAASTGRPLIDILDSPYLPSGLVVGSVDERNGCWVFTPATVNG
jgi:hypothetical protein